MDVDVNAVRERWTTPIYTEGFTGTEDADRREALAMCDEIEGLRAEVQSATTAANTSRQELRERIGELEEALKPFADAWNQWRSEEHALIGPDMYVDDPYRKLEVAAKAFAGEQ